MLRIYSHAKKANSFETSKLSIGLENSYTTYTIRKTDSEGQNEEDYAPEAFPYRSRTVNIQLIPITKGPSPSSLPNIRSTIAPFKQRTTTKANKNRNRKDLSQQLLGSIFFSSKR